MKKNAIVILTLLLVGTVLVAFTSKGQGEPWTIPAKYKTMKNPHAGDKSLVMVGKALWAKHCKSCHGTAGLGDGPKAGSLKTKINSLATKTFQAGTDGEIYYKSFVGRDEMPNFEKKIIDDEDRWAIVNYIRTLAK